MAFDPNFHPISSGTNGALTSSTQLPQTSFPQRQLSSRAVAPLVSSQEVAQVLAIDDVNYKTVTKVCQMIKNTLRSLLEPDPNGKSSPKLNSEKVSKLMDVLDSLDVGVVRKDFQENERFYFDDTMKTVKSKIIPLISETPLLGSIFTGKRPKKLVAFYLAPAVKTDCEKLEKISPGYFTRLHTFARNNAECVQSLTDMGAELAIKMLVFSKGELEELYTKISSAGVIKLDQGRFSAPHFVIAQQMVNTLEKNDKNKVIGLAVREGILYGLNKRLMQIKAQGANETAPFSYGEADLSSSTVEKSSDTQADEITKAHKEALIEVRERIYEKLRLLAVANQTAATKESNTTLKLISAAASKFLAELDRFDVDAKKIGLNEIEKALFDLSYQTMISSISATINHAPILKPIFTQERIKQIVAFYLIPAVKVVNESIKKNSLLAL